MNEENTYNSSGSGSGTLQSVKTETEKLKDIAKEQAGETVGKVKEEAKAAVSHLQDAGRRFASHQKDMLAQKTDEYAQAVRAASEKLSSSGEANMLAGPAQTAAEQLGRLSGYLKDNDPMELLHGLEHMARRRPEMVFGGLFIAGLIAGRFLKSSGKNRHTGIHSGTPRLPVSSYRSAESYSPVEYTPPSYPPAETRLYEDDDAYSTAPSGSVPPSSFTGAPL